MFYTKYNVNAWVRKADKRIDTLHDEEIDDKVELLYSLGYIYNPYLQEFRNHFIDRGFKAIAVYNLEEDGIIKMHNAFKSETVEKYGREQSLEETLNRIDKLRPNKNFTALRLLSSPIGVLLLILSPIFMYLELYVLCLTSAILSNIFINHFITKNSTIATFEGKWATAKWWQQYEGLLYILGFSSTIYCYYVLYLATESYWIPLLIIVLIRFLYRRYVAIQVAREFRGFHEYIQIQNYADTL